MSVRWQHCLDHADNIQKPAKSPLSSRRSYAADRQSVKRDYALLLMWAEQSVSTIYNHVKDRLSCDPKYLNLVFLRVNECRTFYNA